MHLKILATILFSLFLVTELTFAQATLNAPSEVNAGAEIKIKWEGPNNKRDFITIVKEDAEENKIGKYAFTSKGNPAKLRVPDDKGNYELRYVDGESKDILDSLPIKVLATSATISAPPNAPAGSEIKISWQGPDNKGDFITIVKKDSEERSYGKYKRTSKGNPLNLRVPDEAGDYEIRYLSGQRYYTLGSAPIMITAVSASLDAPSDAAAGSEIKISWKGPDNKGDFITIVKENAEERSYGKYSYTTKGSPLKLKVPDEAGNYEIRYLTGQKYKTLSRVPITVNSTSATLEATTEAVAGSELSIFWEGPANKQDYITIVKADAEEKTYGNYSYLTRSKEDKNGKKYVKLRVPEKAGSYEIRYLTGQSRSTLTRTPLTVTSTEATLDAPLEVTAGSEFKVIWTGPNNRQDFITIVEAEAEEKAWANYTYTNNSKEDRDGKPYIKLTAPDKTGTYEIRYLTAQKRITLARKQINVTDVSATLEAPKEVVAGDVFKVSWTGPDNKADYIAIFDAGVEDAKYKSYAYTKRGNPLKIEAPKNPGLHEIRYLMGKSRKSLASIEINVIESKVPGTLRVISKAAEVSTTPSAISAVELILDASGSMLKRLEGVPRIKIAKEAVTNLVNNSIEPGTPFAMRVFGHKDADSCRTDLEIPLNPLDKTNAVSNIRSINAKNLAKTPIAKSLSLVSQDLAGIEGKAIIVLVTDGEETCEGDPKAAIQSLKNSGYDVRVNIVGFAIDELELKETFREWANVGNGSYFDASNAEELGKSIQKAIEIPFEVINSDSEVVATGVLNGDAVEVPPGSYSIKVLTGKASTISDVAVEPEKEKVVTFEQ